MKEFFRAYYSFMKEFYLKFKAEEFGLTQENYWEEVLKTPNVSDIDFKEIEITTSRKTPPPLKEFYKSNYSLEQDYDCGNAVHIAGSQEGQPIIGLKNYCLGSSIGTDILNLNLYPFGMYNDEWFICFDLNKEKHNPPIVLFERSNWFNGKEAISHRIWFSNFEKFILCMTDSLKNRHENNFDKIDPDNNFLSAYDYWKD